MNTRQPPSHANKAEFADYGRSVGAGKGARGSSTEVRPPLDQEFAARGLRYAATLDHAVHLLLGA